MPFEKQGAENQRRYFASEWHPSSPPSSKDNQDKWSIERKVPIGTNSASEKRVSLRVLKRKGITAIDDRALFVAGRAVSEAQFNECVVRALRHLASRGDFNPTKTAEIAGLDPSFLRRVMQKKRTIGLFTLFKIASVSSSTAQDIVGMIAEELRKEVTKQ